MTMATYSIRMDENLKQSFDKFCEAVGMSASTAFNIFAKKAVREQRIPFELENRTPVSITERAITAFSDLKREAKENHLSEMAPAEIEAEIKATRCERRLRKAKPTDEA